MPPTMPRWSLALLLTGCGLPSDEGPPPDAPVDARVIDAPGGPPIDAPPPSGEHRTYAVSRLRVPTTAAEAMQVGLDLDDRPGDASGGIDNQLGMALASFASLSPATNVRVTTDRAVARGDILLLLDLQADDLGQDAGAGLRLHHGADPMPAPCTGPGDDVCGRHLQGGASFDLAAGSPTHPPLAGPIVANRYRGGPGELTVQLSFTPGQTVAVPLQRARAELVGLAPAVITGGKLGGAITRVDLETRVYAGMAEAARVTLAADCPQPATPPGCNCPAGSSGSSVRALFDKAPADCAITDAEVVMVVSGLVVPDLDLDGDGVNDATSLGLGVEAVAATFTPP